MINVSLLVTTSGEVELKTTTSGHMVANVNAADNYSVKDNGQWTQKTNWLQLVVWGSNNENNLANRFSKIPKWTQVFIQWELRLEQYEKDWIKRISPKVIVRNFTPFNGIMKLNETNTQQQIQSAPQPQQVVQAPQPVTPQPQPTVQTAPATPQPATPNNPVETFQPPVDNTVTTFNFDDDGWIDSF